MSSIVCQVSCTFLPSPHGFQNGTQYSLALPPPPPTPDEIPPILSTLVSPFQLVPGFRPLFSGTYIYMGADACSKSTEFHVGLQSAMLFRRVFFANCAHMKYWYSMRLSTFLRLPKAVPKSPFEPCRKHILRNLQVFGAWTKTLTNRETLKRNRK